MKRLIAIVLFAALCVAATGCVAGLTPTEQPTEVPTSPPNPPGPSCSCGRAITDGDNTWCVGSCNGVFQPWMDLNQALIDSLGVDQDRISLPAGSYCLREDITLNEAGILVCDTLIIDLNGYNIRLVATDKAIPVFELEDNGELTILDNMELSDNDGNGGVIYPDPDSDYRGVIVSSQKGGKFVLNGGTLDASAVTESKAHGAAVLIIKESSMYMNGGTVIGAHTTNYGGGIYINENSVFEMTGGELYGGKAGEHGGNLYIGVNAGGYAQLTGGTIYGDVASACADTRIGNTLNILSQTKDGYITTGFYMRSSDTVVTVIPCKKGASIAFEVPAATRLAKNVSESDMQYIVLPYGYKYRIDNGNLVVYMG